MALADIFAGLAEASHQHHKNLFDIEQENRRTLAEKYTHLSEDPRFDSTSQEEFGRRAMNIMTMEPGKKLPKEYENFQITVQPQAPPPMRIPGQQGTSGQSIDTEMGSVPQFATADILPRNIQLPAPAPHPLFQQMPFEKQVQQTAARQSALASVQTAKLKAGEWNKLTDFPRDMPDGKRHKFVVETRINPETGEQEARQTDLGDVANFAPRMGDLVTLERAKADKDAGLFMFRDILGNDLDIDKMIQVHGPYATIRNKGAYYEPASVRNIITSADNITQFRNPYAPEQPGTRIGETRPPVETIFPQARGIDPNNPGKLLFTDATRTQRVQTGATAQPAPPPAPSQVAPAPPPAPAPQPGGPQSYLNMLPPVPSAVFPGAAPSSPPKISEVGPSPQTPAPKPPPGQPAAAKPAATTYESSGNPRLGIPPVKPVKQATTGFLPALAVKDNQMLQSVAPAAQIMFGDPSNPVFESLEAFADVADDPQARLRVGTAVRGIVEKLATIQKKLGADVALSALGALRVSTGSLGEIIGNYMGLPREQAKAEAAAVESLISPLSAKEKRMVARLFAAYGTIPGLRSFTKGGVYQFAIESMDREIPIPGMTGINDSPSYYNKLASLAEEISGAFNNGLTIPPDIKLRYRRTAIKLAAKGQGLSIAEGSDGRVFIRMADGTVVDENGQRQ